MTCIIIFGMYIYLVDDELYGGFFPCYSTLCFAHQGTYNKTIFYE